MTEIIRKLLNDLTPADYWTLGAASDEDAKCRGCGMYAHDYHWIFCQACKDMFCIWCIQQHRLHGTEFFWALTQEPVDFDLLATCATCGHFALVHGQVCNACKARSDEPCAAFKKSEIVAEAASEPAMFWRAYDISCTKSYEAYIKPLEKKDKPVSEKIPFCDRAMLLRVCKQEYGWGHHMTDRMLQQALASGALLKTPARDMTESKFIGRFIPVFVRQKK